MSDSTPSMIRVLKHSQKWVLIENVSQQGTATPLVLGYLVNLASKIPKNCIFGSEFAIIRSKVQQF